MRCVGAKVRVCKPSHPSTLGRSLHHVVVCAFGRTVALIGHGSSWSSSVSVGLREGHFLLRHEVWVVVWMRALRGEAVATEAERANVHLTSWGS